MLVKVPVFVKSPLTVTEAAAVVALLQVPPLIFRLAAVIVAATVTLMAPPALIVTAPKALVAVAPLIAKVLLTVVAPLTVSPSVLVAKVPVFTFRLVTVNAPPCVTVAPELIFRFKIVAVPGVRVWAPLPFIVNEDPPLPVSVMVPEFVIGVAPAIERLTSLVPPPSVKVLPALKESPPAKARLLLLAKVNVEAPVFDRARLSSPPAMAGIVVVVPVAPENVRLEVTPPVNEPEVVVIPPSIVRFAAPMLKAPLVKVSEPAPEPVIVVEADKLTPAVLFITKEVIPAAARSLPVTCAPVPL